MNIILLAAVRYPASIKLFRTVFIPYVTLGIRTTSVGLQPGGEREGERERQRERGRETERQREKGRGREGREEIRIYSSAGNISTWGINID